jgi:hypothetical protein
MRQQAVVAQDQQGLGAHAGQQAWRFFGVHGDAFKLVIRHQVVQLR